jgi:hypothetical protein
MKKIAVTLILAIFLVSSASAQWHNSDQDITLNAEDEESGINNTYYCIDQSDECDPRQDGQEYNGPFTVSEEGINFVRYNSKDRVGNIEDTHSKTIRLDFTEPVTADDYPGGWQNSSVTVGISCEDPEEPDASGCDTRELCKGSSCTLSEGTSATFSTEGQNTLRYRSTDVAGNTEPIQDQDILLDFTPPQVAVQKESLSSEAMNATVACTDELSGCDTSSYRLHVSETSALSCPTDQSRYNEGSTYEVNQHLWVCAAAKDEAGNWDYSNQPVEFSVGTLTTDLDYPGQPGAVITNVDSAIPISLEVGNEEEDKDRTINVSLEGPTQFQDGNMWEEVDLNGVETREFNFIAQPEQVGNSTVKIDIKAEDEGFTVTEEIEIRTRESGSRTSSAGREAPGIGLIQIAVLGLIASMYYIAGRNW